MLGYERTLLSITDALRELDPSPGQLEVTMLIHWPRCRGDIEWMNCEADEANLPDRVKAAGPSPLDDPEAWKVLR